MNLAALEWLIVGLGVVIIVAAHVWMLWLVAKLCTRNTRAIYHLEEAEKTIAFAHRTSRLLKSFGRKLDAAENTSEDLPPPPADFIEKQASPAN